jgi:hypothetical protein
MMIHDIEAVCSKYLTALSPFSRSTFGSSVQVGFSSFANASEFLQAAYLRAALSLD